MSEKYGLPVNLEVSDGCVRFVVDFSVADPTGFYRLGLPLSAQLDPVAHTVDAYLSNSHPSYETQCEQLSEMAVDIARLWGVMSLSKL